jgi:uncharacterized protein YeaO (DUF488 family)
VALRDTYVSNLKAVPKGATRVFVMRHRGNDELAPSEELFQEFKAREAALKKRGLDPTEAHNRAFADVKYEERFRKQVLGDPKAVERLKAIAKESKTKDVWLICYEKPPKRCHRHLLAEMVQERARSA